MRVCFRQELINELKCKESSDEMMNKKHISKFLQSLVLMARDEPLCFQNRPLTYIHCSTACRFTALLQPTFPDDIECLCS